MNDYNVPKLDKCKSDELEGPITIDEISAVLKQQKNNKTPGSDGYSSEFFKFFWPDLRYFITRAVNDIFSQNKLPISLRLGIISCIPKKDKPRHLIKNWRPITLLNVLYKIISGCVSKRIKTYLHSLISTTQTGFLSGRYIGENTRYIYDLMSYTENNNIPGLLMLLDFEKAFDTVAWSFLYKVLYFFGFGDNLIKWVRILNTEIKASILQCGFLSEQLDIQRGCRQGDPVAPYLFILCAEILSILIKNNQDIKGIIIQGKENKISQYADDTTLLLDGSKKSLFAAIDTLDLFSKISGLLINCEKTKLVWIGSKKFSSQVFHHTRWKLDWNATDFCLLGIDFTVNLTEMVELNYNKQIPKINALLSQWKKRILTPIGRVTVLKSLIIPKLNHLIISLPNPPVHYIKSLNKMFFHFIWGSNSDRVKRDILTQDQLNGGLNMINIENFITSLKCSWIKRIMVGGQSWFPIFECVYGENISCKFSSLGDSFIQDLIKKSKNPFWHDTFSSWLKIMKKQIETQIYVKNIYSLPVWFNSLICIDNKHVFYEDWYSKGVKILGDFFDRNGFLKKDEFEIKFNILNICPLRYNGIQSAIIKLLRKIEISPLDLYEYMILPYKPFHFFSLNLNDKGCKKFYSILNSNNLIPTAVLKWNSLLTFDLDTKEIFKICFKTSSDSTLQWLQFRILHRILPIGTYLKKKLM